MTDKIEKIIDGINSYLTIKLAKRLEKISNEVLEAIREQLESLPSDDPMQKLAHMHYTFLTIQHYLLKSYLNLYRKLATELNKESIRQLKRILDEMSYDEDD